MAIVRYTLKPGTPLTEEQLKELEEAEKAPIVYDEDCPPLTDEQLAEFAIIARQQRADRRRGIVSLRLAPQTLEKARKLGNGYTAVLSRMIDLCINDKELLLKCL